VKYSVCSVLLPDRSLEETFQLVSELGYDGVELRVHDEYHVGPDQLLAKSNELRDLMAHHGLEIPVLGTYLPITESKTIPEVFEAADKLGTYGVRISLGPPLDRRRSYWEVHGEVSRRLEALSALIGQFRAKALFEIHLKTLIPSPSSAYMLLSNFDPNRFGVILDPGNMVFEGYEDWKMGIGLLGGYLGHVHVKNASWRKEGKWVCAVDELNDGQVDWDDVIRVLVAAGYDRYLSNENLKDVALPGTTGFIGESFSGVTPVSARPIRIKLSEDLRYLKGLVAGSRGEES